MGSHIDVQLDKKVCSNGSKLRGEPSKACPLRFILACHRHYVFLGLWQDPSGMRTFEAREKGENDLCKFYVFILGEMSSSSSFYNLREKEFWFSCLVSGMWQDWRQEDGRSRDLALNLPLRLFTLLQTMPKHCNLGYYFLNPAIYNWMDVALL